jgi:geranylgeranyl diphosphate synthase type II
VDLAAHLDDRRRRIDAALGACLDAQAACPADLLQALRYSLLAPGKRLRPLLVLLACEACGGPLDAALPAACALEMVHAYSLVHDDLPAMDDDDLRRGQPTCHKQFGEATAILVGDGLQALAFETISRVEPPALAARCVRELATAAGVAGMVGGQMDDLAWEGRAGGTLAVLEAIHRRKTGALITAALRIGGLIGTGGETASLDALTRFGASLGLAFQIADDLLDATGRAEDAGKGVGKDAGRGKLTYPGLLGLDESRRRLRQAASAARAALEPLGEGGRYLTALVQKMVERDR